MDSKIILVLTAYFLGLGTGEFTYKCMKCICNVESKCNRDIGCKYDIGLLKCGPYQLSESTWRDCGHPGDGYKRCANNMACAEDCVKKNMKQFGTNCTKGFTPFCEDYARIHNGGPMGCQSADTQKYWAKVKDCCDEKKGCDN